jgi:hypothetical protein
MFCYFELYALSSEFGNFQFVYINQSISMIADGSSMTKVEVNMQAPKLFYIHSTCFDAGKPMEFFACGSNLLQRKIRYAIYTSSKHHLKRILHFYSTEVSIFNCIDIYLVVLRT